MKAKFSLNETDLEQIKELFLGHRIVAVEIFDNDMNVDCLGSWTRKATGRLRLDDGRIVFIVPNLGGCSCGAGDYKLESLERVDNIITRVDVLIDEHDKYGESKTYRIFVLAGDEQINAMSIVGDDGNGYYGTGFELLIVEPE